MLKKLTSAAILSISLLFASAQSSSTIAKECTISSGVGIAGINKNLKKAGRAFWLQLDYKLAKEVSLAFDFENVTYTQPGYYSNLPFNPNEVKVFNNNFSLLLKYYVSATQKLKFAFSSGWTYTIIQNQYYNIATIANTNGISYTANTSSYNEYRLPLLIEANYSLSKTLAINARAKYNLNTRSGNTYSAGLGISLKL